MGPQRGLSSLNCPIRAGLALWSFPRLITGWSPDLGRPRPLHFFPFLFIPWFFGFSPVLSLSHFLSWVYTVLDFTKVFIVVIVFPCHLCPCLILLFPLNFSFPSFPHSPSNLSHWKEGKYHLKGTRTWLEWKGQTGHMMLSPNLFQHNVLLLLLSHFSRVRLCVTPQTATNQAPPSRGFSRQEHWSGLPFPSPIHETEKWKWSCSVMSDS